MIIKTSFVCATLLSFVDEKSVPDIFPVPSAALKLKSSMSPAPTRLSSLDSWRKLMGESGWMTTVFFSPEPVTCSTCFCDNVNDKKNSQSARLYWITECNGNVCTCASNIWPSASLQSALKTCLSSEDLSQRTLRQRASLSESSLVIGLVARPEVPRCIMEVRTNMHSAVNLM